MNDFTKEELESILNWGEVYTEFGHSWTYKIHKPLMEKIQSMINNYCDLVPEPVSQEICCVKCQRTLI
jgi:hypothetical protein